MRRSVRISSSGTSSVWPSTILSRATTAAGRRSASAARALATGSGTVGRAPLVTATTTSASRLPSLFSGAARLRWGNLSGKMGPAARRTFATGTDGGYKGSASELVKVLVDSIPSGTNLPVSRKGGKILALAAATGTLLLVFPPWCVVPAGHVGLLDVFGDVSDTTLTPGFHLKNPLAKCVLFSTKTQRVETTAAVPSREGLIVQLEVSALYRVDPSRVQHVYKTLGREYAEVVLLPHFKSIIRELTSAHEAKGLYTAQVRTEISSLLTKQLNEVLKERGILVDETPINGITMPDRLVNAIQEKLRAEQEAERMAWILQREEAEARRKIIEARGIAEFQKIVQEGISEQLLRWKGIEATEKLATSNNAKMVIVGKSDGLPVVLAP